MDPIEVEHIPPAPLPEAAAQYTVRMRDRVRLATDVYLTDDGRPGPAILIRLPYDKAGPYTFIPEVAAYLVDRGYHVVAQDVRGKFRSEGETLLFVNEVYDGYDTLEWIVQQPWSDGDVAMWGDSYYGYTQWAAVSSGHPALKAISPRVTGTRLGELPEVVDDNGAMEVEMSIHLLYPVTMFHSNDIYRWEVDWSRRPYVDSVYRFFAQVGSRSMSFDLWAPDNPVRLRRFPNGSPFDARSVPVLQTIGWWDNCAPWGWQDARALSERPAWALNQYLLIESIDHENVDLAAAGRGTEPTMDEIRAMLPRYLDPSLEFFDIFVKGRGSPRDIPRVRWNLAHTTGLRASATWPPPGVRPTPFALTADGCLRAVPEPEASWLSWTHNPDDLVPSPVSNPFAFLQEYPEESAWSKRPDVLVFDGPVAEDGVDYAGPVRFRAHVGTSGPTMDVFVRLLDVAPDDSAHLVARGQVHLPAAGEENEVDIDMGHVGYRLRSGHRLRAHVASSDFPEFMPQPGNGRHPWTADTVESNQQFLLVGGEMGATLHLRVLPPASRG